MADLIVVAAVLFGFCIAAVIVLFLANSLVGSPIDNAQFQQVLGVINQIDKLVLFAAVIFHLGILLMAFAFPTNAAFMPLALLVLIVEVFVTGNLFNALATITNDPILATGQPAQANLITIMNLMPIVTLVIGLLLFIVQYGRTEGTR